jgi:hypothetical protein
MVLLHEAVALFHGRKTTHTVANATADAINVTNVYTSFATRHSGTTDSPRSGWLHQRASEAHREIRYVSWLRSCRYLAQEILIE